MAKGWHRASLEMKTHPLHRFPDVTRRDLLIPSSSDRLALLAACFVCGVCLSVFWVYLPAFLITPFVGQLDGWLWGAMAVGAVTSAVVLYVLGRAHEQRDAEWAQKA
jgi:uncharacterized membrane protein YdjX (TVP38/TMEM64 family)